MEYLNVIGSDENTNSIINSSIDNDSVDHSMDQSILIDHKSTQTEYDINQFYRLYENSFITVINPPLENNHVANKEYVDFQIKNVKWERDVSKFHDPRIILPKNPSVGERFISSGTGNGWKVNRIYEYTADVNNMWVETIPNKGCLIWVQFDNEATYIFNGMTWERFGKSVDHNDLKNIGKNSHRKIDDHINNSYIHLKENTISHNNIKNIGLYSHEAIDSHILNTTTAHYGQNLSKNGTPEFKSLRVMETIMPSHVATKDYVDSKCQGINWIKETKEMFDPTCGLPENNIIGDRYISLSTANDWKKNYIYEYIGRNNDDDLNTLTSSGREWIEIIPIRENSTSIVGGNIHKDDTMVFNGTDWVRFGSFTDHNNLRNNGLRTHKEIDEHLNNNTTAHFGQNLTCDGSPIFSNLDVTNSIKTNSLTTDVHIIEERLQIGKCTLPNSYQSHNNFAIIGNNDKLNVSYIYSDASSDESINIINMRSRGDIYKPEGLLCNTPIGSTIYSGHDGETYKITSLIQCITTEDYNKNNHGSAIQLCTTMNGTSDPKINMKIDHDGTVHCFGTNDSSSNGCGSLIVDGGISVEKNMIVGKSLCVCDNLCFGNTEKLSMIRNDTVDGFDNKIITICGGGDSFNKRGSMITVSGVDSDLDGTIQIKAGVPHGKIEMSTCDENQIVIDKTGRCTFNNDDDSKSSITGSIITNGGIGIGKNLYVGGSKILLNSKDTPMICPDTTYSIDNSHLNLCGGGDADSSRGGFIKLIGNNNSSDSGSIILSTGNSIHGKICFTTGVGYSDDKVSCCEINNSGSVHILTETNTTSTDTGALIVNGGVNIGKTLITSSLKCINCLQLPLSEYDSTVNNDIYSDEEVGRIYYDVYSDCVKVLTKSGWKKLLLEKIN